MTNISIIGAGLAGLIAAHKFPTANVYDAMPGPKDNHRALLRFRTDAVSRLTGIPFKKVRVSKGIYYNGKLRSECTLDLANMYSRKVTGKYAADRSITNLAPVDRFIAPDDFYMHMVEQVGERIKWNTGADLVLSVPMEHEAIVSTMPMAALMETCFLNPPFAAMESREITVRRWDLGDDCDLYQTVYFPNEIYGLYRASITGHTLIAEYIGNPANDRIELIVDAFGMKNGGLNLAAPETSIQKQGKIIDLPRQQRESILYELTRDFNIFSLGRFATHRNILLDDVVDDLDKIERLMMASQYHRALSHSQK